MKWKGEVSQCGVNGSILCKGVWRSAVIDFRCVSCRILMIKFRFSRVKVCAVVGYSPNEEDGKECEWKFEIVLEGVE